MPALEPLKLVVGVELRGGRDIQMYRVELPGPKITKDVAAAQSWLTARPDRMVRVGVIAPRAPASPRAAARARTAPAKAATGSSTLTPRTSTSTAPRDAPEDSPSR